MKNHFFYTFLFSGLFYGVYPSYAMDIDSVTSKTDKVRNTVNKLSIYLDEVNLAISNERNTHNQSLDIYKQKCKNLELEISKIQNNPKSEVLPTSFLNKIKEREYDKGYGKKTIIHIYLENQTYKYVNVEDIIESNENYFKEYVNIISAYNKLKEERKNNQLDFNNKPSNLPSLPIFNQDNNNMEQSWKGGSQGSSILSTPPTFNQEKIKVMTYSKNWSYYNTDKTVHLYLERSIYRKPDIDDFVESNENYFKQFVFLEQENNNLKNIIIKNSNDLNQLKIENSNLKNTINENLIYSNKIEEENSNISIDLININEKKEKIEEELTEEIKKTTEYLKTIKKLEEQKGNLTNQHNIIASNFQNSIKNKDRTIEELQEKISKGMHFVSGIQNKNNLEINKIESDYELKINKIESDYKSQRKKDKENFKLKVEELMNFGNKKLNLILEEFQNYKSAVNDVLGSSELLQKINDRSNNKK